MTPWTECSRKTSSVRSISRRGTIRRWTATRCAPSIPGTRLPTPPSRLRVVEQIPAGHFPTNSIEPGTSARIFTGAPVPRGADAVVRQEDTDQGSDSVAIGKPAEPGQNVRRAGEDIARGVNGASRRHRDRSRPSRRSGIARCFQSDDLPQAPGGDPQRGRRDRGYRPAGRDPERPQDRQLQQPHPRGTGPPRRRRAGESRHCAGHAGEPSRAPAFGRLDCDLIITTGGISVGEHDFIRPVLAELGGELSFWRLRMRPGAPVGFGMIGDIPWLGLPGNPVSTMVTFELFARPAIRKICGRGKPFRASTQSHCGGADHAHCPAAAFSAGRTDERPGWRSKQGSPDLRAPAF